MLKQVSLVVLSILVEFLFNPLYLKAQEHPATKDTFLLSKTDTFFLSKKKGLLGRIGKSISTGIPGPEPVKVANPFIVHAGKTIRYIAIMSLGFERNIYDTNKVKNTFGVVVANAFHKNTREKVIANNLFFRIGSKVNPYLIADNERHLRDQVYIQEARILVVGVPGCTDSADVIVITKDVFTVGGNININGVDRMRVGIKEENFGGSGSKVAFSTFYERDRQPNFGYGGEIINRNVKGTFIDWSMGFQTYKSAFSSGRGQETYIYTHLEKPLVSLYIPWIGAADLSFSKTKNDYPKDTLYQSDYRYSYLNADAWLGYNFGSKNFLSGKAMDPLRKFVALRVLHQRFNEIPARNLLDYDYRYADISGALMSVTVFKQDFYRTNFIYGFGRNEDVPEGFSASVIAGWTGKDKRRRSYYGIDAQRSHFNKKGFYSSYTLRAGSFSYQNKWEDIDLLLGIEHFTRLNKLGSKWLNRNFYGSSFTKQIRPNLNQPLFLNSAFGLPYYANDSINAHFRGTVKGETVFYDLNKYWGFRFAPFFFGDVSMVTPIGQSLNKSDLYSALGAGVRARNENLIFGTIELRGYFFPRPIDGMRGYKVEVNTSIRFKYNSTFIHRPDFVVPN